MFVMEEGVKESSDAIVLKNTLPYSIAFKVDGLVTESYISKVETLPEVPTQQLSVLSYFPFCHKAPRYSYKIQS